MVGPVRGECGRVRRAHLIAESGGGLNWILAGMIGAIVGAVANAWVLLVEILR
ncbi:MAG: hypothetical protein H0V29_02080 [Thermoleophilaceae bacterium]|nr:hypothetical protein [Thermoleophilaceae bacterium]